MITMRIKAKLQNTVQRRKTHYLSPPLSDASRRLSYSDVDLSSLIHSRTIDEHEEVPEEETSEGPPKNSSLPAINSLSYSTESLDEEVPVDNTLQIEDDEDLTQGPEPDSWSVSVDKKVLKKLSSKEIKRQDVIFEFIMTEKHHLRTLKVMQKIFNYGMTNELNMEQGIVSKVFPMLNELVSIASSFYDSLKAKQKVSEPVHTIGDVLCQQFEGEKGVQMKTAYGVLCSRQKEAVSVYKDLQKNDRKFQVFIKKCSLNALCRRWSIPECILSVSHRLTKYQLLIEAIMKPTKSTKADKHDTKNLERALGLIKKICNEVDYQVQEHERSQRLLDIYNKIDARSTATLKNGKKFKKSDLLAANRKLIKEGELFWKSARGRLTEVHVVLLSDLLLVLCENNQKYTFASQDNKPSVISLENMMVRDVAIDNKSIYIISRYAGPEMYEITCQSTHNRKEWKRAIEQAVATCPVETETITIADEEKTLAEENVNKMNQILEDLREQDKQLESIIAIKMKLQIDLHELARKDVTGPSRAAEKRKDDANDVLLAAMREASRLQSSAYEYPTLPERCASSAGEKESAVFHNLLLPKRAETFSGFDSTVEVPKKRPTSNVLAESSTRSCSFPNLSNEDEMSSTGTSSPMLAPDNLSLSKEEDDVLSPISPFVRDNPQRSPLPQRRANHRYTTCSVSSNSPGGAGGTDTRERSYTAGADLLSNKVQFNLPSDGDGSQLLQDQSESNVSISGGLAPEQLESVNILLQHFNNLVSIVARKDTDMEVLNAALVEANYKIETTRNHSTSSHRIDPIILSPPAQDAGNRRSSSLHDKSGQPKGEKWNHQWSLPERGSPDCRLPDSPICEDKLQRIAFGDMIPSNQVYRARNKTQSVVTRREKMAHMSNSSSSLQVAAVQQNRYSSAELLTRNSSWDADTDHPVPPGPGARKQTPAHLMSTTNEQASIARNVQQQLPMQLSKGKNSPGGPKTSPVQQVLPKKLASGSNKNPSQKKNNFPESAQSEQDVVYL